MTPVVRESELIHSPRITFRWNVIDHLQRLPISHSCLPQGVFAYVQQDSALQVRSGRFLPSSSPWLVDYSYHHGRWTPSAICYSTPDEPYARRSQLTREAAAPPSIMPERLRGPTATFIYSYLTIVIQAGVAEWHAGNCRSLYPGSNPGPGFTQEGYR